MEGSVERQAARARGAGGDARRPPVRTAAAAARQPVATAASAPAARPPEREPFDLEELLGGRVLGWVGGIAVVLAAVFFLVMAVHNGWIDESTRVVLAFLGSTACSPRGSGSTSARAGRRPRSRRSRPRSRRCMRPTPRRPLSTARLGSVGLCVAGLVGIAATAIAVRWDSQIVAGIGDRRRAARSRPRRRRNDGRSLAFMAIALVATVGVLLWRRWDWLAVVAFVVSGPAGSLAWI